MEEPNPAQAAGDEPAAREEAAHDTSFTAESAPQSPVNEPDPFNELENLYTENAGLKDKVLRTLAEMENLRRRSEKEIAEAKSYGVAAFAREMLTLADNLGRALASLTPEAREQAPAALKTFIEGIELTERDFNASLGRRGVTRIEPLGQKFDPNFHEALFEVPNADAPAGTVVQVIEPGYRISDRMLRPAKVGVARGGPKSETN